jgi:hypothetical protein
VECPDCAQDDLEHFGIPSRDEIGVCCPECDAMWVAGRLLPFPGHDRIGAYVEREGLDWDDIELGPSTEQVPAPEGLIIHRKVRPRSEQRLVFVVGDTGKPRIPCTYCPSGNLVDAVLQATRERFLYCANCEAVWLSKEAVLEQPPTFLDTYLESRNAEWTDVVNEPQEGGWHGVSPV